MKAEHKVAKVRELPNCDFCKMDGVETPAKYDGKTKAGSWANMCQEHFEEFGIGLGLGKGQMLEVQPKIDAGKKAEIPVVEIPLSLWYDSCEVACPHCGETRTLEPDANYVVTCEGCGNKYRVISQI